RLPGVGLTVAILLIDLGGLLAPLERWFYDLRARQCQLFSPPPTRKLYHLDIDDQSLQQLGRWPWPRGVQAELIDELRQAGPRIMSLDILLDNNEDPQLVRKPDGTIVEIDHDRLMADACQRAGNVLIP